MPGPVANKTTLGSRGLVRLVLVVLVCISAALLLSLDTVYLGMLQLLAMAKPLVSSHPVLGPVAFVVFSALSAILAFFSSAVLVPVAVFAWGKFVTVVLLWLGWLLGGMLTYAIGRGLRGQPGHESRLSKRLAGYLAQVPQDLGFTLVLLWQLALPSEIPGYLCGYLGVSFRTYASALAIAELPYAIGAVWLGESMVNRKLGWVIALGVVGATLGFFLVRALHRRLPR